MSGRGRSGGLTNAQQRRMQVLVSDAQYATWADRATLVAAGIFTAFFTDVGVGGSWWSYHGGRWRPVGGRVVLKNLLTIVTNNAAPKVVLDYCILLTGLVQDGDVIMVSLKKDRTGGTSDTDATDCLLGTVATTLGTSLGLTTSALATTQLELSLEWKYRRINATTIRPVSINGSTGLGASNAAIPDATVSNMDSQMTYLQVSSDLTTAGGEVARLTSFMVTLIAGA